MLGCHDNTNSSPSAPAHALLNVVSDKNCVGAEGEELALANMRFLNIRVALDFKSTPLKTFLKNLDLPQSYDCFRNTKKDVLCTAKLKHPFTKSA